ncbi:FAD linked oxidase domain-containing protein [Acidipropionibacterium acidipropionici ATCC 4875]|uniref:FAD linked oxidase domain-containing protein n=1 Tax=Acidipropionibacterium acidipropionici (strain ATCC 4875 / DSM 20272 / JCM 6432 / NBRC 12425 / NCIMB 8070 / 4) TaxID=1171373 RepID=K7S8X4_ACIA4|nr:FAD-linked oxidase C-terminal domain-containing protein [Acidipropionibacterium acidipropionici]AFV91012.1 FAD linked oxidase domain-containing protein [Acidipropionibacterium acidipropionici ATCC 4875]ALN14894.1 hypothetical protein ASQ49_05925 [Acidipropionibacterium acidipropionici]
MTTTLDPDLTDETAPHRVVTAMRGALPGINLDDSPTTLAAHRTDRSAMPGDPDPLVLARPASTEQVSALLAYANAHRIPVVPQGTLTGVAGAASAISGAILLDLTAMDAIIRIDADDMISVAQPGVIVADLAAAAAKQGLFYAPDPASAQIATLGGNVATNAGGMRCIKYGVTRESVRSLEVVLADGTVMRTRPSTIKTVGGLDLTGLIVGSEGTLAVVTEITVKLLPAPGPERGVLGLFPTVAQGLSATNRIAAGPRTPARLEFMDGRCLEAIRKHIPDAPVPAEANAWALAVTDARDGAEEDLASFERIFADAGATTVQRADSAEELEAILEARRQLQPSARGLLGGSVEGDIAVPRSALANFSARVAEVEDAYDVTIALGGHVGDGNLHPIVAYTPAEGARERADEAVMTLSRLAQEMGGTMSGEHGVGLEKLPALDTEMAPAALDLQRRIKGLFDPNGILNPGKKY